MGGSGHYVGKILVLDLWTKILSTNQIAGFFKVQYLKEKVNDKVHFCHADKNGCFLKVDTTILVVCN